jgi:anti-sigma B factor antagonist
MSAPASQQDDGHFRLDVFRDPELCVLKLSGELDLASCPELEQELVHAATLGTAVVVDLRELGFIDSTGIAVLVKAYAQSRQNGSRLRVTGAQGAVERVFTLTGVSDALRD